MRVFGAMLALAALTLLPGAPPAAAKTVTVQSGQGDACIRAIQREERTSNIPQHLLMAIALAESGRRDPVTKRRTPWPWTMNNAGDGRFFASKAQALATVRQLRAQGRTNIDVGCMQINMYHHGDAFDSLEEAFDPPTNVAYAAHYLRSLYAELGSWAAAAGRYHSATPVHHNRYRKKVMALWSDVRGDPPPEDLAAGRTVAVPSTSEAGGQVVLRGSSTERPAVTARVPRRSIRILPPRRTTSLFAGRSTTRRDKAATTSFAEKRQAYLNKWRARTARQKASRPDAAGVTVLKGQR